MVRLFILPSNNYQKDGKFIDFGFQVAWIIIFVRHIRTYKHNTRSDGSPRPIFFFL